MLELLSQAIHFITAFIPRMGIMLASHRGIRYRQGKHVSEITPGIYWYWPLFTEIHARAIKRQTVSVPTQTVYAKCKLSISAGCVVVFEINDIIKALYETWEIDETIVDEAEALLGQVIGAIEDPETSITDLNRTLTHEMRRRLARYGVSVKRANLRDFAPSKVYRVIGRESYGTD